MDTTIEYNAVTVRGEGGEVTGFVIEAYIEMDDGESYYDSEMIGFTEDPTLQGVTAVVDQLARRNIEALKRMGISCASGDGNGIAKRVLDLWGILTDDERREHKAFSKALAASGPWG